MRDWLLFFDPLWGGTVPAEQERIVQLLVDDGIDINLRTDGLTTLLGELRDASNEREVA